MTERDKTNAAKNPYEIGLAKNPANFQPLTPLDLPGARCRGVPETRRHRAWRLAPRLWRVLRALAPPRLGARRARHRAQRHRLGDARQHAGHARMPLRRADARRRAEHAEHPPRRENPGVHARPCRGEGADRRQGIRRRDARGAEPGEGEAPHHRLRRSGISKARASASAPWNTRSSSPRAIRAFAGRRRKTNGTPLR